MSAGIFIDLGNGIKGESVQAGFEDHIAASSLQWGAGRGISTHTSGVRETSRPSFAELVFTKSTDLATNDILKAFCHGTALGTVKITFVRDDGAEGFHYLAYELSDCLISSYSLSSGGDTPSESVSVNYAKIISVYKKLGSDHSAAGENDFEYNLMTHA